MRGGERAGGGARTIFLAASAGVAVVGGAFAARRDARVVGFALLTAVLAAGLGSTEGTRLTTIVAAVAVVALTAALGPPLLGPAAAVQTEVCIETDEVMTTPGFEAGVTRKEPALVD